MSQTSQVHLPSRPSETTLVGVEAQQDVKEKTEVEYNEDAATISSQDQAQEHGMKKAKTTLKSMLPKPRSQEARTKANAKLISSWEALYWSKP